MASQEAALAVEHVEAGYGGVVALQDVSITARPGTITAVLGANGAGKTTLLATISGLVRARKGRVALDGTDLTRRPPEEIVRATRPFRARTSPLIVASRVVLPAPFAPSTAVIVPGRAVMDTSWSATTPP